MFLSVRFFNLLIPIFLMNLEKCSTQMGKKYFCFYEIHICIFIPFWLGLLKSQFGKCPQSILVGTTVDSWFWRNGTYLFIHPAPKGLNLSAATLLHFLFGQQSMSEQQVPQCSVELFLFTHLNGQWTVYFFRSEQSWSQDTLWTQNNIL